MNFLSSISSSLISAGSAALANASGGVPGVQGYQLGDKVLAYEGKSIWTQWSGKKKDDSTPVSVFSFDLSSPSHISSHDRRSLFPLARNAFRKLRALRHPNILKFLDGSETDSAIWIVTEPVRSLALELEGQGGLSEESKVYGLLHVCTALGFLNRDGQSVHGGLRTTSVWVTPGGEWKLGGMEVCSRLDEPDGAMWHVGGLLPDSRTHAPPEVRRGGWTALKEYDASTLDSYLLHLFLYTILNGPLPTSYLSPSASETPSLPQVRGSIPPALFQPWRRLGNPNPAARLKTAAFLDLGNHPGEGWWTSNRLVKLSTALEGFSLATEDERMGLIRTLKAISSGAANAKTAPLPSGFLKYKVLPSLVHTLEFSSGSGGAPLLPVILDLSSSSDGSTNLDEKEYQRDVIQPLVRMYATPDRAIRMALLENLERYADKLQNKDVNEKVWPHLQTGLGDVVPVIREATVKAIPLIAPKLNDRILNNDLLRVLSKTQTDVEPGIRTNTCILLSRLSRHLQTSTQRKVLIPAFARALRDPFVHARIAGLMALMATCEVFEKEDLAGKVIPAMSICLVDREKTVRDQAFKAIDMFVKKCESLTASMPETVLPETAQQSPALQAASQTQPGLATNAAGAAGALAGWAFASVSKKLSSAEMAAPIERRDSSQSISSVNAPATNGATAPVSRTSIDSTSASPQVPGGFGGVAKGTEDWGGDLMDVNDDDADWDEFESGQAVPARIDPLAARLSSTKPKSARGRGGSLRLGAASRSSGLRIPLDMDAMDSWDLDESGESGSVPRAAALPSSQRPIVRKPLISATSPALLAMAASTPSSASTSTPASPRVVPPSAATNLPSLSQPKTPSIASPPLSPPSTPTAFVAPTSPPRAPAPPAISVPPAATPPVQSPVSLPRSPLPPTATPPPAPVPPTTSTVPPVAAPVSPVPPPSDPPSRSSTPVSTASGTAGLSKEEKAARLAQAREERKARMAAAKAGVKR
ncbi:putative inactive serine/threonine-protein kinase scy1 [Rhodotorula toruloides]|nr:putative inactive serine/threonine-protein kinase scy1 [Rhodotorula toruloides]